MKILFSPSEGKIMPNASFSKTSVKLESSVIDSALKAYQTYLKSASEAEIAKLFGSKRIDLEVLNLCQNCHSAPTIEAIKLYSGVGYKALDFNSLESSAKSYILKNLYIFSNLFGAIRADYKLPFYNLHQGCGVGAFSLNALYKALKVELDKMFCEAEVIDLRAEAYIKAYGLDSKHYIAQFLKQGKKISHYAKHYRGIYARAMAQGNITKGADLEHLEIPNLALIDIKCAKNATILTYEAKI